MGNLSSSSSGGIGFFGMMTILFIGLKVTGYISWSWFWVLAPLLVPLSLILLVLAIAAMVAILDS